MRNHKKCGKVGHRMPHHPRGNSSPYFTRHRHCPRKGRNQGSGRSPDFYDDYAGSKALARRLASEKKAEMRAASDAEAARQRQLEATFVSTKPKPPLSKPSASKLVMQAIGGSSVGMGTVQPRTSPTDASDYEQKALQLIEAHGRRTGRPLSNEDRKLSHETWEDYFRFLVNSGIG